VSAEIVDDQTLAGDRRAGRRLARRHQAPRPTLRRGVMPFMAVALLAQLSAVTLPGTRSMTWFAASCAMLTVVVGLALVLPRLGCSSWIQLLAPVAYLMSLALLIRSQGALSTGLQPLVLLPIVWVALYHRPREGTVFVLAAVGVVAFTAWFSHLPTDAIIRGAGLFGLAGVIAVFGADNVRCWLGDAIDEREEALRQARILGEVAREMNSTLDPERVVAIGVRVAAEIVSPPGLRPRRANYCRISAGVVRVDAECDEEGTWRGATWRLDEHPLLARAVWSRAATSGSLDELGPTVRELARRQGVAHGAWVPVVVDGEVHGVLAVAGRNGPVSDQDLSLCIAIVRIMELALTNALAHEHFQRAALTDPLTSLANRRGLEQLVLERRGRRPLGVLAVDVDRLKDVNDRHGHAAGDELLLSVAEALGSVIRAGDVVARIGGDEFACVVLDADEDAAARVAARMLEAVVAMGGREWVPRLSIGVAALDPGAPLADGIQRADRAMYAAKRAGGMRYVLAAANTAAGLNDPCAAAADRSRPPVIIPASAEITELAPVSPSPG
jgi:diguanylate cyclase (GGDEF)-like protein